MGVNTILDSNNTYYFTLIFHTNFIQLRLQSRNLTVRQKCRNNVCKTKCIIAAWQPDAVNQMHFIQ